MKLLYANGSNCAQRVLWAINDKSLSCELLEYEHLSEEKIRQLSPLGKVPAMSIGGVRFAESVAILEYLEETHPSPALLPEQPIHRAKIREVVEIVNGWVHPVQCSSAVRFFYPDLEEADLKLHRRRWLEKTLCILHDELLYKQGSFAVGDSFTWADVTVIPIYVKGLHLGIPVSLFPKFNQHIAHCLQDQKISAACPADLRASLDTLLSI